MMNRDKWNEQSLNYTIKNEDTPVTELLLFIARKDTNSL